MRPRTKACALRGKSLSAITTSPSFSLPLVLGGIWPLRMTCARSLLGEPQDTLDEKSCSDMSFLARFPPRVPAKSGEAHGLGFRTAQSQESLGWRGKVHACCSLRKDLVRSVILIGGMYNVMPNRCPCPCELRKQTPKHVDRYLLCHYPVPPGKLCCCVFVRCMYMLETVR